MDLKFDQNGLIPAIVQDYKTNKVLMMAYMNEESIKKTIETKKATYFSRSKNRLWVKGETTGHFQYVKEINVDCDNDSILLKVEQIGVPCHTLNDTCFYKNIEMESNATPEIGANSSIIDFVYNTIIERKENPVEGSYTNYLFDKGIDKILKKVGEESAESIIAAKNLDNDELIYEVCDLIYHLLVLLANQEITPSSIYKELRRRNERPAKE